MLRVEEFAFTSRHAVTLDDKDSGRNAFYPPSLEFWILVPFYSFLPSFFAISFLPFQPTIASRATDNVISICIYVPTVPSTGFFYTVIHTIDTISPTDFSSRFAMSQSCFAYSPFVSIYLPTPPFPFVQLIRNANCELWKK